MNKERFDRFENMLSTILSEVGAIKRRMDLFEVEMLTINRQLKRMNKRLKQVEDDAVTIKHAVHDLSLETKKHNQQIDFLINENLQQSQRVSSLIKNDEHHDNRIGILFERMAVG